MCALRYFVAGSLLLLTCVTGCSSTRVIENTRIPEITIDEYGAILVRDKSVTKEKLASAIKAAGFIRDQEVNILIPDNVDRSLMRFVAGELARCGYPRMIFVKNRKASAIISPAKK